MALINMTEYEREYGFRMHVTPDGNFPGVTTVLSATADKSFLRHWKRRVGEKVAEQLKQDGIDRGNFTHNLIEGYLGEFSKFDSSDIKPYVLDYLNGNNNRLDLTQQYYRLGKEAIAYVSQLDEIVLVEQGFSSALGYAGSPDCIAMHDGKLVLLDWKTSAKRKTKSGMKDYCVQLAAYRHLIEENTDYRIDEARICLFYSDEEGNGGTNIISLDNSELHELFEQFLTRLVAFKERLRQLRVHSDMIAAIPF